MTDNESNGLLESIVMLAMGMEVFFQFIHLRVRHCVWVSHDPTVVQRRHFCFCVTLCSDAWRIPRTPAHRRLAHWCFNRPFTSSNRYRVLVDGQNEYLHTHHCMAIYMDIYIYIYIHIYIYLSERLSFFRITTLKRAIFIFPPSQKRSRVLNETKRWTYVTNYFL
jgi:hypothetical protein